MNQYARIILFTAVSFLSLGLASFALPLVAAGNAANGSAPPTSAELQTRPQTDQRRSGSEFMSPSTQAMQRDDTQNPGMLWVQDGETLWNRKVGQSDKSCASCHGAASASMRGGATRYPAFDAQRQRQMNLTQRINKCRQKNQQAEPLRAESQELLSIESYVAYQSRGMPATPPEDARLEPFRARGLQRFRQRIGQLNLSLPAR